MNNTRFKWTYNPEIKSNNHTELVERIYKYLQTLQFREYARGWFKGYIIVSGESGPYSKQIKRVNPRINLREYDFVSAYPKLLYADTDGVIVEE